MKKILIGALVLILLALIPACKPQDIQTTFENLLAADYEVYYLFHSQGLPVDTNSGSIVEYEESFYQPSTSKEYRQLKHLQRLVESVYAHEETTKGFLEKCDNNGNPLFVEIGGQLYQSIHGDLQMPRFELIDLFLVEEEEARAVFTLKEESLDGSLYHCTLAMIKTNKGWRLEGPRQESSHILIQEGSNQSVLPFDQTPQQVAEEFLSALTWGDTEAIENLTGALPGTYSTWTDPGINNAQIDMVEEGESYGTYQVKLQIQSSDGPFPQGEHTYILSVGITEDGQELIVTTFWPEPLPYNWLPAPQQEDSACNAVLDFIRLFGQLSFPHTHDLPSEVIAEYCLTQLAQDRSFEELINGISPQDLKRAAYKYFGVKNFSALETKFYDSELKAYHTQEPIESTTNIVVLGSQLTDTGVLVETHSYTDPLCTQNRRIIFYSLASDSSGEWQFIAATEELL